MNGKNESLHGIDMMERTDRNNNPTAFTTDIAKQAGLKLDRDYEEGDPFPQPSVLRTARLLGDPIDLTIKVIDVVGFETRQGRPRWTYINIPKFVWHYIPREVKVQVIGWMYKHEGGTGMLPQFEGLPKEEGGEYGDSSIR